MTQEKIITENSDFYFSSFEQEAMKKIASGQALMAEGGVLTPRIKGIIESSLNTELAHHLDECEQSDVKNRRNGKIKKSFARI